jgi:hypothetical protein
MYSGQVNWFLSKFLILIISNANCVDVPGDSVISASRGGEIAIRDLNTPDHHIKWRLSLENGIYSMALGQDHLLTVNW